MAVTGDPSAWEPHFPTTLVPEIVGLIVDTWAASPRPGQSDLEVPITRWFRSALVQRKNALRTLPVRIDREAVDDDVVGTERGRLDLRFVNTGSAREDVYFAFECKRLNVKKGRGSGVRSLARPYVLEGLSRFVTGQYGPTMVEGGMIGYVMDGNVTSAARAVNGQLVKHGRKLKMRGKLELADSTVCGARAGSKETVHSVGPRSLRVQHVLLPG